MDLEQLTNSLNLTRERLEGWTRALRTFVLVLAASYVVASSVSAYMMTGLLGKALSAFNQMSAKKVATASLSFSSGTANYRDIEKAIKERNLFNQTGEYPEEKGGEAKGDERRASAFDINAPCSKPTLNVELLGTIYLGSSDSVATLQEKGYSESDIYREGDLIVGNDAATVAKIERNRVILNNNGVKECLELAAEGVKKPGDGFPTSGAAGTSGAQGTTGGEAPPAAAGDCQLDEKYVQEELGPGFGTIIQKARLVPNTTDNQMNGFKIFAIDQASLLGKTGLQNGDVITQVNETSLKQPEQGFSLYQAFQDEKEVRIHILRRGTQQMMITCRIK